MAGIDEEKLETQALAPKRVQGDELTAEQHSLTEQIQMDRYLKSQAAVKSRKGGWNLRKIAAPGAI